MKGKKIKRILAGLSSSLCMMACSPRKSDGLLNLNAIMVFERLTKAFANLSQTLSAVSYLKMNTKAAVQNLKGGDPCLFWKDLNPTYFKSINGGKSYFEEKCSNVIGLSTRIVQLREIAATYTNKLLMGSSDSNNVGIMISGPSGCGKSYLTSIFAGCFVEDGFDSEGNVNKDCKSILRLSSASVDPDSKVSVTQQLFGTEKSDKTRTKAINPNLSYIEKNPDGGIIIFEEGEKAYNRSFAELFRDILDNGGIIVDGIRYPMKNYIIIFTTNASNNSLKCIDKPLTQKERDLGYVKCDFDKSFLNRFEHIIVPPLDKVSLYKIFDNLINTWNDKNERYGVSANISDDTAYEIASFLYSTNQGGRKAKKLFDGLLTPLWMATSQKIAFERSQGIENLEMIFEIGFDKEKGQCFISGMHEDLSKISEKDSSNNNLESKNSEDNSNENVNNGLDDSKSDSGKNSENNDSGADEKENSSVNGENSDLEKESGSNSSIDDNNSDESDSDSDKKGFNLDDNREIGEVNA